MEDLDQGLQKWCEAIPTCLKPYQEKMIAYTTSPAEWFEILVHDSGSLQQAVLRLLDWHSQGFNPWWYPFYLPYERIPEELLKLISLGELINILGENDLTDSHLEGAARYFYSITRYQPQYIELPAPLKEKLLSYCIQSAEQNVPIVHRRFLGEGLSTLIATFSIDNPSHSDSDNQVEMLANPIAMLSDLTTEFSFELFNQLVSQSTDNIFISPLSVLIGLSLLSNGAAGDSRRAILEGISAGHLSIEDLNQSNALLRVMLKNQQVTAKVQITNSMFVGHTIKINSEFQKCAQQFYGAEFKKAEFSHPLDALVLINTIYFKDRWEHRFAVEDTKPHPFTLLSGTSKMHPLMFQTSRWEYFQTDSFQAIAMPYEKLPMTMYVFLPAKESSLEELQENLSVTNWNDWVGRFRSRLGMLGLPRFKLHYANNFVPFLSNLGMECVFDPLQADFSNLGEAPKPVWISQVIHKTGIAVDELGTEAFAITIFRIESGAMIRDEPESPFEMIIDRPFFFLIFDQRRQCILFLGSCVDPQE